MLKSSSFFDQRLFIVILVFGVTVFIINLVFLGQNNRCLLKVQSRSYNYFQFEYRIIIIKQIYASKTVIYR